LRLYQCETTRQYFRGPAETLSSPYFAWLGGTVNFGIPQAGPDAFLEDQGLHKIIKQAETFMIEVTRTHNCSNPFYKVHPRRNN